MKHILVSEVQNHIATIILNRPEKKNALSIELRDEMTKALFRLAADINVKAVVITGSGDFFSAGFDFKEFEKCGDPQFNSDLWASSDRFHHACLFFPLPLIAGINGPALGGGFDLATMCDIRIASDNVFFSHPEIVFGPVMYSPLHEIIGGGLARELCLTGREISANEALKIKLVSSVVKRENLQSEIDRYTSLITRAPRENIIRAKAKIIQKAGLKGQATLDL